MNSVLFLNLQCIYIEVDWRMYMHLFFLGKNTLYQMYIKGIYVEIKQKT